MTEKVSIPVSDNPTRSQSSLTAGNIRYRDLSGVTDASYIVIGVVTKVFYKKGTLDYSLSGTSDYTSLENISGSGSAPIPVDFWGYNSNNKPFGHYRSVKIGDKVALAFIGGKLAKPIVIGVYPSDTASYELISPVGYESGDDSTQSEEDMVLGDKKVYSNQQIFYRSGSGDILRTLNGNSFMQISDNTQDYMSDIWHTYDNLADVYLSDGTEVEPETETAQAWLLVHEDNPTAEDGDSHLTRFYVNKKGEFQLVFMDTSDENTPISILEGSKDTGFTLTKRFDNNNLDEDSTDYVTLNLGDSSAQSFKVEASSEVDSKNQSASLEVKSSGVYIDGENLEDYINSSTSITGADIDNALPDSTYFTNLKEKADKAGADAEAAAEAAQSAGEDAKNAGLAAEQAGEDAKAQATDIKNRIIYYTSISPEKDVYVPGKYLIINTDTYIADGTIKNAYIEDAAIDSAKIASEAVGASQIEDLAVTRAKIANLAVGSAQIEDLAVTDEKVGELSFNHMIGKTLDADQIDVVNLHGDNITVGTITADKLIINGLGDITANLGTVTSGKIVAGDGSDGVDVSGLDADDPDQYTPYKKSLLKAQIAVLEAQANSAIAYGEATDNDYSSIVTTRDALLDGTASLLSDMTVTTEFDHTKIQTWETNLQTAISDFQSVVNNALDKKIGTTADGKNAINEGTEEPTNPNVGDLFLKQQTDGTYAIEIYTENGWTSPALQAINDVAKQVSSLPENYYSAEQPTGTDFTDGSHWYELTGTDSNGNPIYVAHLWNSTTKTWDKMLNSGEVDNANQISQVKSGLTQAQSDIATSKNNITTLSSNLESAKTDLQNQVTDAQNNIITAQNNIKTNTDAISDANGNISSLQSSASQLESDMTDAQNNITTLQQSSTEFKTDIADNKGNINSLSETVSGLSNTVSDNSGNITTLQTRANGFDVSVGQLQNSSTGINQIPLSNITTVNSTQTAYDSTNDIRTLTITNGAGGTWGGGLRNNAATKYEIPWGQSYTYSVEIMPAVDGLTWNSDSNFYPISGSSWNGNDNDNVGLRVSGGSNGGIGTSLTPNVWNKVWVTIINSNSNNTSKVSIYDNSTINVVNNTGSTVTVKSRHLKGESGSVATNWCLSPQEQLTSTNSYAGLTINSSGLTQVAGSMSTYLNNTNGFEIQNSGSDIFHVDTSGNLTMQGNITAGNISGVNFTGNSLTLAGTLAVTGSISADNGNVVINSSGLTIKGAGLTIGDSSGNTTTYIQSDGTFITNKGVFTGSVTSSNVTITGGDINMNGGKFHVDSSGNVTANSIDITGGNVLAGVISGTLDADSIILKGAESTLHISGDDLMFQENSGEKWITDINSNGISFTGYAPSTSRQEFLGGIFINYEFEDEDINGLFLTVTTGANMHSMISNANGDEIGINVPYVKSDNAGGYSEANDFKVIYNASGAVRQTGLHIYDDSYYSARDPLLSGNASESGHINCSETGNFVIESLLQNLVFNSPKGKNIVFQGEGSGGGVIFSSLVSFAKSAIVGSGNSGDQIWVRGAGNFDGTVSCKSLNQTSLLSKKTNISKIDPATALDKINQTNVYDYQYKEDVESGSSKHYASFIIDDVNEVSEYTEPDEFLSEDKKGRDDGTLLAYAVVVIKELIKQNSDLQMRVTKLEIEGNNK